MKMNKIDQNRMMNHKNSNNSKNNNSINPPFMYIYMD